MGTFKTTDSRRRILELVAEGKISPGEGAELLATVDTNEQPEPQNVALPDDSPRAVRVVGTFRALSVVGDHSVSGAVAEGQHRVRSENGIWVFDHDEDEEGFFLFGAPGHYRQKRINIRGSVHGKPFGYSGDRSGPPALRIRMHPDLPLEIDMTAGSARVEGVTSEIKASLTAGSGRFEGIRSPIQISVDAGSVNVHGLFNRGDSLIRCTAGKVRVELEKDSDVSIVARATLGKIVLPDNNGDREWSGIGSGKREAVIGNGNSRLDIEATTGTVFVELDR